MDEIPFIFLDLHDVIAGYVLELISRYGWPENPKAWTLHRMFPNVDWVTHFSEPHHAEFLRNLSPISGAVEGTKGLAEIGPVRILTATKPGGESDRVTRQWVHHYLGPDIPVICTGSALEKVAWINRNVVKYNIAAYVVDDHPVVLSQLTREENGLRVIRFKAPWNDHPELDHLVTVRNWDELETLIRINIGGYYE